MPYRQLSIINCLNSFYHTAKVFEGCQYFLFFVQFANSHGYFNRKTGYTLSTVDYCQLIPTERLQHPVRGHCLNFGDIV